VFQPKAFRSMTSGTMILLMLFLIAFEVVFRFSGGDTQAMNEAALQRTRSQLLVNSVYTLAYRPIAEHGQAMRNLQTVLPTFEQGQVFLQANPAADVQNLLQQALNDYLPLIAAIQGIITHSNSMVDPLVVNILVAHERSYLVTMNTLMLLLPQHIEDSAIQLFVIQVVIETVFLAMFLIFIIKFDWKGEREGSQEIKPLPVQSFVRRLILSMLVLVLVLVLVGLGIVPLGRGNETLYFDQVALQQVRCETLAASAVVPASRPTADRTLALSDALVTLLLFQQGQTILLTNGNADVHHHVVQATSEYQTMSTAARALITQPSEAVDPVAVDTIVSHTQGCAAVMNGIVLALQSQMEQQLALIFFAEVGIEGVLITFFDALLLSLHNPSVPT